jgi:hypothetical protein
MIMTASSLVFHQKLNNGKSVILRKAHDEVVDGEILKREREREREKDIRWAMCQTMREEI